MNSRTQMKRGRPKRDEPHVCICGYTSFDASNFKKHNRICYVVRDAEDESCKEQLRASLAQRDAQIAALEALVAEKDRMIEHLQKEARMARKRPHNITNNKTCGNTNNYNVNNQINVFGKESLAHITEAKLQELIQDPDASVARLVTLKHSVEENMNVRVPNCRDRWVELLVEGEDGEKTWQAVPKDDVIGELVESTALELDAQASEDSIAGRRFTQWHERLLESTDQKGPLYRDQCSRVHKSLVDATRK